MAASPGMLLTTEGGASLDVSSRAELERALADLGAGGNAFAVLSREDQLYIQAAATGRDRFDAEYRDGSEERHFSSARKNLSLAEVVELFGSYVDGTEAWRASIEWRRMDPSLFVTPRRKRAAKVSPRPRGDATAIIVVMFGIVGAVLLSLGVREVAGSRAFLARAEPGRGTVVENTRAGGRRSAYYPVVEFRARDGRTRSFRDRVGNVPPRYQVGDVVTVLYDPSRPDDARIDDRSSLWFGAIGLTGMGTLFCGIAAVALLRAVARARSRQPRTRLVRG